MRDTLGTFNPFESETNSPYRTMGFVSEKNCFKILEVLFATGATEAGLGIFYDDEILRDSIWVKEDLRQIDAVKKGYEYIIEDYHPDRLDFLTWPLIWDVADYFMSGHSCGNAHNAQGNQVIPRLFVGKYKRTTWKRDFANRIKRAFVLKL